MNLNTEADPTQPKPISKDLPFLACFGLLSIPLVCGAGYSLLTAGAFILDVITPDQPETKIERILSSPPVCILALIVLTTVVHSWLLSSYLPQAARSRWVLATSIGASIYWGLFWSLIVVPPEPVTRFLDQLTSAAGPFASTVGWVGGGAGIIIGGVAGAVLGGVQWRVLRRHHPTAGWWSAALIGGSALLGGAVLAILRSLSGWPWIGT